MQETNDGCAFDAPMQARTAGRDIFGPLDDHLPEVRIPAEVKLEATRAAATAGLDLTTWLRELVYASVYGPEHLASLYEKRARRVLGNARRDQVGLKVVGEVNAK
jgi:hypothetical protein